MLLSNMLFITIYENIPILVLLYVIFIKEEEILSFNREKCFVSITVMLLIYECPRGLFWSWQKRKSVKTGLFISYIDCYKWSNMFYRNHMTALTWTIFGFSRYTSSWHDIPCIHIHMLYLQSFFKMCPCPSMISVQQETMHVATRTAGKLILVLFILHPNTRVSKAL